MIKLENTQVFGWEAAIRGMRNPKNSWGKSDSEYTQVDPGGEPIYEFSIGPNDHELMMSLAKGGPVHAKYRRMIQVYVDITAPLYWWKEADTYKVGTVANSCSTMHKIHSRDLTIDDFSYDGLSNDKPSYRENVLRSTITAINECRTLYLETDDKKYWREMILLLPSSYNQKRTWLANYEVLAGIYPMRKNHKLDEWHDFCRWIEELPYSELITGGQ